MAPLIAFRSILRRTPPIRCISTGTRVVGQRGLKPPIPPTSVSPKRQSEGFDATRNIPGFGKPPSITPRANQVYSYFMVGAMGLGTAVAAKALVHGICSSNS